MIIFWVSNTQWQVKFLWELSRLCDVLQWSWSQAAKLCHSQVCPCATDKEWEEDYCICAAWWLSKLHWGFLLFDFILKLINSFLWNYHLLCLYALKQSTFTIVQCSHPKWELLILAVFFVLIAMNSEYLTDFHDSFALAFKLTEVEVPFDRFSLQWAPHFCRAVVSC